MVEETVILRGRMGSYSVGTNGPDSDEDFMEIVLGDEDVYLGMDWWGDQGTKEKKIKDENGNIIQEITSYELRKFLRLCQNFNPNVIPLLWLREEDYIQIHGFGHFLLQNRNLFNSKIAVLSFCGYAQNQLKKMGEPNAPTGMMGAKRKEIRDKFGYDTKYAYHTIRLGRMLCEFLESNGEKLNVWRGNIDKQNLLDIRNGEYPYTKILEEANSLLERAKELAKISTLPDSPNKHSIRQLCKIILRAHLHGG